MAIVYKGIKMSPGIAMGQVRLVRRKDLEISHSPAADAAAELCRFEDCLSAAVRETERLVKAAGETLGGHEAGILDAQLTFLKDEYAVVEPIKAAIWEDKLNVAQAVDLVMGNIKRMFEQADDEYMRQRAADAEDIRRRLLSCALNHPGEKCGSLRPGTILVAEELTPSDTIRMDLKHVAAIVTEKGGYYSHVGIISRSLSIPSVYGVKQACSLFEEGETLLVDGDMGEILAQPAKSDLDRFEEMCAQKRENARILETFRRRESRSADGQRGLLCANIGTAAEAETALQAGAEGVGLLRSEFLYMNRPCLPDEETQFQAYRRVLEVMGDRPVIIRTLDAGGDKELPSLHMEKESNPFLGLRAIRLCLANPELFLVQLRALLRAGRYGNLRIMFPMIACQEELRQAKALLAQAREELERAGAEAGEVPIGIMIEIPSAALQAEHLAREADFFSIGTNDLIQYTLAAERGNQAVERLFSPFDPGVLKLISMTARAAAARGIECGMCGEAAADPRLVPVFWGMGLREFSMAPAAVAGARQTLAEWSTEECRELARRVLACEDRASVMELLQKGKPS